MYNWLDFPYDDTATAAQCEHSHWIQYNPFIAAKNRIRSHTVWTDLKKYTNIILNFDSSVTHSSPSQILPQLTEQQTSGYPVNSVCLFFPQSFLSSGSTISQMEGQTLQVGRQNFPKNCMKIK